MKGSLFVIIYNRMEEYAEELEQHLCAAERRVDELERNKLENEYSDTDLKEAENTVVALSKKYKAVRDAVDELAQAEIML